MWENEDGYQWSAALDKMESAGRLPGKFKIPWYEKAYAETLGDFQPTSVLEIGVDQGLSLEFWQMIWPDATITGVDIDKEAKAPAGTKLIIGDIKSVIIPGMFDLIVDDGSHHETDIRHTLAWLWQRLRPGGWLVIEDLVAPFNSERYQDATPILPSLIGAMCRSVLAAPGDKWDGEITLQVRTFDKVVIYPWMVFLRRASA